MFLNTFLILFLCFNMFLTLYDAKNEGGSSKRLILLMFGILGPVRDSDPSNRGGGLQFEVPKFLKNHDLTRLVLR